MALKSQEQHFCSFDTPISIDVFSICYEQSEDAYLRRSLSHASAVSVLVCVNGHANAEVRGAK